MISNSTRFAAFALLIVTTCTGCLREPFHGKTIESREDKVWFMGYTPYGDTHIEFQAQNPKTGDWVYLGETVSDDYYWDMPTGKWYYFEDKIQIPFGLWEDTKTGYSCDVRAVTKSGAMLTFNASFEESMELSRDGPMDEFAERYIHGQEATVYANY